ncbi:S41 family peptidase [Streptomyces sp. wa22]|uniref:S41 family peptidase n=1 Tax=Streptomyces sp. wa22 TaxID=1828244 RepID=UPI0011CB5EC4|nr:S41 family peptidase [Streptomyces sp. wa22]TXS09226.1 peptidase S41 [Streptomyces sp. wa22]
MPGHTYHLKPRGIYRGAALTLVFASVLATAAATGSLPREDDAGTEIRTRAVSSTVGGVDREEIADAAADAEADGKSGTDAAEEVVSRSGDRWGAVYDEREYEDFEQALDGSYTGVGVSARRSARGEVAGRGGHTWTTTLRRARLSTDPVSVRRLGQGPSSAVLIKVAAFTKGAGTAVRDAVEEVPGDAGILLDLRANSGGLVTEAVTASSAFLDGGLVATYDVHGEQRALYAEPGGDTGRPVVVLVDGGTMSAAELLTGALQDRGRAVTVGSRTFGKGSVQMPSKLPGGSVAELTVGHYRTPAGRSVEGSGITPDVGAGPEAQQRGETVLSGLGGGS